MLRKKVSAPAVRSLSEEFRWIDRKS